MCRVIIAEFNYYKRLCGKPGGVKAKINVVDEFSSVMPMFLFAKQPCCPVLCLYVS